MAKNLLGAFHSPAGVVANVGFLREHERPAPPRRAGRGDQEGGDRVARVLALHRRARARRSSRATRRRSSALVHAAAAIKTALIERDPYERDLRRPLNFGHTIGHPLETVTGYGPLLHGEAVAFGMVVESRIAHARAGCSTSGPLGRWSALLRRCGLPTDGADLPAESTGRRCSRRWRRSARSAPGSLRFVLPVALGETVIADDVEEDEVRDALAACGIPVAASVIR